jgi:serine/threonine protein kinase
VADPAAGCPHCGAAAQRGPPLATPIPLTEPVPALAAAQVTEPDDAWRDTHMRVTDPPESAGPASAQGQDHAREDPRAGQVIAGRYRVVERIGQGGMGSVYSAWQLGAEQRVALKFINPQMVRDPDAARRFINEARSYARLQHPNAVALHDFGQDESGALFICMELFQGTDLARILAERKRLEVKEAVEIALQVGDVLAHAHSLGIVHRDLKPENVLVRPGLRGVHVKVVDFGIARLLGDPGSSTQVGPMAGTPGYMAPEQVQSRPVDGRADIYALGLLLFQLVTGRHPFSEARSLTEIMFAQVSKPVPRLAEEGLGIGLPAALDDVIQRATRKDPNERYQRMEEMVHALAPLTRTPVVGNDARFEKTGMPQAPDSPLRRRRAPLWIILGGVMVAVGVGALGTGKLLGSSPPAGVEPPPTPRGPSPPPPPPPPSEPAPRPLDAEELERVLKKRTVLDVLVKARGELAVGNLDGVRQLLAGAQAEIEALVDDPQVGPQLKALREDLAQVTELLGRARALAKRGDCAAAIKVYEEILRRHAGMRPVRAARDQCRRMLPPTFAE